MSYDEIMAIMAHEYQLTLAQSEADGCYINIYSGEQGQFQEGKNMSPSPLKTLIVITAILAQLPCNVLELHWYEQIAKVKIKHWNRSHLILSV